MLVESEGGGLGSALEEAHPEGEGRSLVEGARQGDRVAFDRLVRRYRGRIYAAVLRLLGDAAEAEDVTQDAFLRAWRAMPRFEGRSDFYTWLYRIALNLAFGALRARRTRRRRSPIDLDDARVAELVTGLGDDPHHAAEVGEASRRLREDLDALPEALRATVVLVIVQGLSQYEAASALGCAPGTVAWRVHVARGRLRPPPSDDDER